ncbi:helix-turn-helix domain-containing protein (plasmid) [Streptomyces sp. NBC_01343]|uniref:helix-turn-helix domain-containing protein n=1 Tax=Streptomyces sp. NBC_01343 TaxID=2903832 RepID=UPI002E0FB2A9|nr:helix-turn-helix domain-containing protein [Streptomyces sp. NBC_01343]
MAGRPPNPVPDDAPEALAELTRYLRELIRSHGAPSYAVLAQRSGLGKSTIAHALSGQRLPRRETLERLLDAIAPPGRLDPSSREACLIRWRLVAAAEAAAHASRLELPLPPAGDAQADMVLVEGDKVWLIQAKHTGRGEAEQPPSPASDAAEHRSAIWEVARAQNALDLAMDRLEQATADVAKARAALHAATSRVLGSMPADEEGARHDTNAAVRIADDNRPDQ